MRLHIRNPNKDPRFLHQVPHIISGAGFRAKGFGPFFERVGVSLLKMRTEEVFLRVLLASLWGFEELPAYGFLGLGLSGLCVWDLGSPAFLSGSVFCLDRVRASGL